MVDHETTEREIAMRTAGRLATYGLSLVVIAGGAWTVGSVVGPIGEAIAPPADEHAMDMPGGHDEAGDVLPGLAVAANGYRLELDQDTVTANSTQPFRFRIIGSDRKPVTRFEVEHDKRLHLVLVRRDTSGYQHVHPELDTTGTWSVPLTLNAAGSYRMFTDFKPEGGSRTTLGADIHVSGAYQPEHPDSPMRTDTVDGYEVELDGALVPGKETELTATVTKHGAPVTDLQPYLGAYGHLVTLRAADLGYLHVHPLGEPGDGSTPAGPRIRFAVTVPTAGRYRLFLGFQHGGQVRTAEFTVDTELGS
jgi:hypothetical protein